MKHLWLIYALISAFMASLVAIFGKIGLKNLDANLATTIRSLIMTLFLFIVVLIQGKLKYIDSVLTDGKSLFFIFLAGIAGALSWLFYFLALKIGKVSQIVSIDKLSLIFAIFLAFFFLGEKINLMTIFGAILMIVGSIIISLQ